MATTSDIGTIAGPLRLTAPTATAYDQSPGEQQILQRLTPENLGAMYGLLVNQRASGGEGRALYDQTLRGVNAQQYQLGQAKLRADELQDLRATGVSLIDKGGVNPGNIAAFNDMFNSRGALAGTDTMFLQGRQAATMKDMAAGINSLSEAGVAPNPGQAASLDPAVLARLSMTSGMSRPERVAMINGQFDVAAAGARGNAEGGGVQVTNRVGSLPGEDYTEVKGKNPDAVARQTAIERARRTGNAPANQPPGQTSPTASGVRSADQARTRIRELGLPQGTRISERGGRFEALLPDGTRQPLR